MSGQRCRETVSGLLAEYADRLREALEMLTAESVEIEEIPPEEAASILQGSLQKEWQSYVWGSYRLNTTPPAVIAPGASELTSRAIGAKVLLAAGIEEMSDRDVSDSYAEVQQSAVAALAHWLSRHLGRDIQASLVPDAASVPNPEDCYLFRLRANGQKFDPVYLSLPAEVYEALQPSVPATVAPPPGQLSSPASETAVMDIPTRAAANDPSLARVLDFELPLRVSFGKARLPLRDVLNLTTGSIIELDRAISDPVEIVVNNRVVGRGEVVVVEGNYGVRIQEITTGSP